MSYRSTKTYGHELGLSCAFRQWRAESHCRLMHGYALSFRFEFAAAVLDHRNWVMDFGGLKPVKEWLCSTFDHKTLVAVDDPEFALFERAAAAGVLDMVAVPAVGCEAFANMAQHWVEGWMIDAGHSPRVRLLSTECREHAGNSAMVVAR